ncbi:flagellar hook-basal body complex protein FliE [Thioclava sp. 15-R06ZXC-3]|jgi:flagellar hook-basal body complex protein FliE|uniref:Flagellar hook-basal body complex protein FliE n=1 Tax=Thioclava arctica TaxID=3238301 RepID=A0ABV3TNU2_9RHOB
MSVLPLSLIGFSNGHSVTEKASDGASGASFLKTVESALNAVSDAQSSATSAENAVAAGKPGASQATALVLSDRAEIGWNGVVAVRNEVVSAYQTLSNMQI